MCCASTNQHDAKVIEHQASIQKSNIEYREKLAQNPTLEMACDSKCSFKMFDPSKLPALPKMESYLSAHEANVEMFKSGMSTLGVITPWLAGMRIMDDAFNAAGGGNSTIHNTSTINGDDNQINATAEMGGSTSSTVGDAITDNSTVDNSAVDNSFADSHDSTSKPTVVEQPEPVIVQEQIKVVEQPEPVIVQEQIKVVEQPEPIIIDN